MEAYKDRLIELIGTNTPKETLDGFKMAMNYTLELVGEYDK